MKNIQVSLFVLSILILTAIAQDKEPVQLTFRVHGISDSDSVHLNPDWYPYFQQDKIFLSWHWGGNKRLTKALKSNGLHHNANASDHKYDTSKFLDNTTMIVFNYYNSAIEQSILSPMQSIGFRYDPTLPLTKPGEFINRPLDETNSVFGWLNRQGDTVYDSSTKSYRLKFLKNITYLQPVLSNIWPDYNYVFNNQIEQTDTNARKVNGEQWYLAINLRRLDSTVNDNSVVLTITLPYQTKMNDTSSVSGLIKFAEIPNDTPNASNRQQKINKKTRYPAC